MAGLPPANLALDGGDPRKLSLQRENIRTEAVRINDHKDRVVGFEEYMYYATITRAEEKEANARFVAARGPRTLKNVIKGRFSRGSVEQNEVVGSISGGGVEEKNHRDGGAGATENAGAARYGITEAQRENTGRAMRTASWGTIFYLITTDILGPMGAP